MPAFVALGGGDGACDRFGMVGAKTLRQQQLERRRVHLVKAHDNKIAHCLLRV